MALLEADDAVRQQKNGHYIVEQQDRKRTLISGVLLHSVGKLPIHSRMNSSNNSL